MLLLAEALPVHCSPTLQHCSGGLCQAGTCAAALCACRQLLPADRNRPFITQNAPQGLLSLRLPCLR